MVWFYVHSFESEFEEYLCFSLFSTPIKIHYALRESWKRRRWAREGQVDMKTGKLFLDEFCPCGSGCIDWLSLKGKEDWFFVSQVYLGEIGPTTFFFFFWSLLWLNSSLKFYIPWPTSIPNCFLLFLIPNAWPVSVQGLYSWCKSRVFLVTSNKQNQWAKPETIRSLIAKV